MSEPKQKNCLHFAITRDPILSRHHVECLCGAALPSPDFVATFEVGKLGDLPEQNALGDCRKCWKALRGEFLAIEGRIFVYGVRPEHDKRRCTASVDNPSSEVTNVAS